MKLEYLSTAELHVEAVRELRRIRRRGTIREFTPATRRASRALVRKFRGYPAASLVGVMANFLVLTGQAARFSRWLA